MSLVDWYRGRILATQQLPLRHYLLFFLGKVWGAFALGLLVAAYISGVEWATVGWIILIMSFLLASPALPKILKK